MLKVLGRQLLKKSNYTFLFNHFYVYGIGLILWILTMKFHVLVIGLIIFLYHARKHILWPLMIFLYVFYTFCFIVHTPTEKTINQSYIILEVTSYESYYRYRISDGLYTYHLNYRQSYDVGNRLYVEGKLHLYRKQTMPGGFNSYRYWLGQGIQGQIRASKVILENNKIGIRFNSKDILILDLFKDYNFIDSRMVDHLFKLSSLHLSFLVYLVIRLMYYLDIKDQQKYIILSMALMVIYFIGFAVIVLRLTIKYFIKYLNLKLKLHISNFNIEWLTFVLLLLINPFIIYNQTFLVIYALIWILQLKTMKSRILDMILIPMIISPFLLHWYQEISWLSLVVVPIFAVGLRYVFIPTILLASILPMFNLLPYLTRIILDIEAFISLYDVKVYFVQLKGLMWVIYFGLLIFISASKTYKVFYKRLGMYVVICIISFLYTFKPLTDQVIFLDVGQGDSAVIFKDNHVVVVDAYKNVSSFLKHHYVYQIDYLILTHTDTDHVLEAAALIENFEVKYVVLNAYGTYNIKHPNMIYIGKDNLNVENDIGIIFFGPMTDFNDTNDNSIVFKINVLEKDFLFTGDIGIKAELRYVSDYGHLLKSDILKSPHHGSKTSSSTLFLNTVSPKIVVVSVGPFNMYQLPDEEIIFKYEKSGLYIHQTKDLGALLFIYDTMKNFPP